MFSAPTWILVPFTASTTGTMSIAGTQKTTSTSSFATNGFKVFTNSTASLGVMFIFQFPAIIFLLAMGITFFLVLYNLQVQTEGYVHLTKFGLRPMDLPH